MAGPLGGALLAALLVACAHGRSVPGPTAGGRSAFAPARGAAQDADTVGVEAAFPDEALDAAAGDASAPRAALAVPVSPAEFDLPITVNERVAYWLEFYQTRYRARFAEALARKGRYEPYIRGRLRARGMPEDLVYLALIESGFSPRAYSRAHAVGIWQFVAATARRFGLEVSAYVDERRDVVKATEAALDYLQELYDRFGSWYLAAAAYNTGENRVERILQERAGGARGHDSLFWKIDQYLPRETRDYVPLMLAAGRIAKNPARYGFTDLRYHPPLAFDEVEVPGGTALRAVARAAAVPEEAVRELNPHFVRRMTPPGRTARVRIPPGRREIFAANFARLPRKDRVAIVEHVVRPGETLSHLAVRFGTTVAELRALNGGLHPRRLRAGQRIHVIPGDRTAPAVAARARGPRYHRVRSGDTLWALARRYDVTVRELRVWNGLGRSDRILPGQRLRVGD